MPIRTHLLTGTLACLLASACGSSQSPEASSAGTGGQGGQTVAVDPWAKPACDDPGKPQGPVPSARADGAGVLTANGRFFLLFGGDSALVVCGDIPKREHVGDSWLLDTACGAWSELSPAQAPPARARHAMAYDANRDRAVLFGGRTRAADSGPYTLFNDVWAFDFDTLEWSEVTTSGPAPSPRCNTSAVIAGDELLVFGGNTSTSGLQFSPNSDLHILDLTTGVWRQETIAAPPPARLFHAATYDAMNERMYVVSGGDENAFLGPFFNDVWVLDRKSASWHAVPTTGVAEVEIGRIKGAAIFRQKTDQSPAGLVTFGGHDSTSFADVRNDTMFLDLGNLSLPNPAPATFTVQRAGDAYNKPLEGQCDIPPDYVILDLESPERRQGFAVGQTQDGGAMVVVAGDSDCGRLNDAWWYHSGTQTWTPIRETLPGLACPRTGNDMCKHYCF